MRLRHPGPTIWLMTDERADLAQSLRRLPRGAGLIFRHYDTPPAERRQLWRWLHGVARRRGLLLVRAGADPLPGEVGRHNRRGGGYATYAAHDRAEARAAIRACADAVLVSPVFVTRSHPGAAALGPITAARIARDLPVRVIALGGMNARRFARIRHLGFDGWAAIDAFAPRQKRKAVPR